MALTYPLDLATFLDALRIASVTCALATGSTSNVAGGSLIISAGLLPDTLYEVQARGRGRLTSWTVWIAVTTPDSGPADRALRPDRRGLRFHHIFAHHRTTIALHQRERARW